MSHRDANNYAANYLAQPHATGRLTAFAEGFAAPLRGFRYLAHEPDLWRYAVMPVLMNLFITAVTITVFVSLGMLMFLFVHPWLTEGVTGSWRWVVVAGEVMAAVLLFLVCGGLAVLTWRILSGFLCGYYYGKLAEHVERSLGLPPEEIRSIRFTHELVDAVIDLVLLIAVNGALLTLDVVPIIGALLALTCSLCFTWLILGINFLGFPLTLRGQRRLERFQFGLRHAPHTLGLGSAVFLLQFIPIAGAVFLTTGVVGAVLLHRRISG